MMVSTISLAILTINIIASTPALADPNVMKPYHTLSPAVSAILFKESSSNKFSMEILPEGTLSPSAAYYVIHH